MPVRKIQQNFNRLYRPRKEMLLNNFLGGIAWSLGTLIGATIILGIVAFALSKVNLIPILGAWIAQIIETGRLYSVK